MSILNKLMDTMRLTEEDDEDYFIDECFPRIYRVCHKSGKLNLP